MTLVGNVAPWKETALKTSVTKQFDSTSNSSDLYLGVVGFEFLSGHLLIFVLGFPQSVQANV